MKKAKDLILVIDFQNVYLPGQPWACPESPSAIENILKILRHLRGTAALTPPRRSVQVVFTRFIAPEKPSGTWKTYNEVNQKVNNNAWLNELVDPFKHLTGLAGNSENTETVQKNSPHSSKTIRGLYPVYDKSTYSSLTIPEIAISAASAGRVILTGVVAECCVLATAFHAIDLGLPVIYLTDAVAGLDEPKEKAAELMLEGLSPIQVQLMTTEEYLSTL